MSTRNSKERQQAVASRKEPHYRSNHRRTSEALSWTGTVIQLDVIKKWAETWAFTVYWRTLCWGAREPYKARQRGTYYSQCVWRDALHVVAPDQWAPINGLQKPPVRVCSNSSSLNLITECVVEGAPLGNTLVLLRPHYRAYRWNGKRVCGYIDKMVWWI